MILGPERRPPAWAASVRLANTPPGPARCAASRPDGLAKTPTVRHVWRPSVGAWSISLRTVGRAKEIAPVMPAAGVHSLDAPAGSLFCASCFPDPLDNFPVSARREFALKPLILLPQSRPISHSAAPNCAFSLYFPAEQGTAGRRRVRPRLPPPPTSPQFRGSFNPQRQSPTASAFAASNPNAESALRRPKPSHF